jgi:hypothetical protein
MDVTLITPEWSRIMSQNSTLKAVGESAAYGAVREVTHGQIENVKERLGAGAENLTGYTADRVEALAGQVRELGNRHDRRDEAQAIARRLERSADYLRFRPLGKVPGDAWAAAKQSRVLWATVAVTAGLLTYSAVRRHRCGSS